MNIDFTSIITTLFNFKPELLLACGCLLAVLADSFLSNKKIVGVIALITFILTAYFVFDQKSLTNNSFLGEWLFKQTWQKDGAGIIVVDNFTIYFKVLISICAAIVTLFSFLSKELDQDGAPRLGEYYTLLISMTFGMFLLVGANDLLLMYVAIEVLSLSSYAIVGFTKKVPRSTEAAMKYVIYGGVASGVMLFGISLIYGMVGSLNYSEINMMLSTVKGGAMISTLGLSSIMILTGLGYKISAAPFHAWTPDVYEGSPITVTAFLSVASKAAGFAALIRFIVTAYPTAIEVFNWKPIIAGIAVLTMTLGNLAALQQSNLKRLLAYSSIAHAGYMLMGLAIGTPAGISAIMFYLAIYLVMNLGAFFGIQKIAEQIGSEEIEDFKGLGPKVPIIGGFIVALMISLVGLPPTSGFVAKFFLFSSVIQAGSSWLWLAVVGVINSVISLYYYVRVIKVMYLEKNEDTTPISFNNSTLGVLGVFAVASVLLGLPNFFGPLVGTAGNSLGMLTRLLQEVSISIGGVIK
ncbi:MAG: NADH-quinone oxidoreductase subunit N [Chlorobiota bacterium]|nr:MAG: NADH-quinone oxidoreductase subunit N [Chlorobiota bacterium]